METYKDDPCTIFYPKKNAYESVDETQANLIAKMHKAIAIIQFKMESRNIARHPEFHMESRNLLHKIDYEKGTIEVDGKVYPLIDKNFPTVDPEHPYQLTAQEQKVLDQLTASFTSSQRLKRHIDCLLEHGSLYLVCNSNLLVHGSIPLNEDGSFREIEIEGRMYKGKAMFDKVTATYGRFTAEQAGGQVAVAEAHLAVIRHGTVDAEGLKTFSDRLSSVSCILAALLERDGGAHYVGPLGVLEADVLRLLALEGRVEGICADARSPLGLPERS